MPSPSKKHAQALAIPDYLSKTEAEQRLTQESTAQTPPLLAQVRLPKEVRVSQSMMPRLITSMKYKRTNLTMWEEKVSKNSHKESLSHSYFLRKSLLLAVSSRQSNKSQNRHLPMLLKQVNQLLASGKRSRRSYTVSQDRHSHNHWKEMSSVNLTEELMAAKDNNRRATTPTTHSLTALNDFL